MDFAKFVSALSDNEIDSLLSEVYSERRARAMARVSSGNAPKYLDTELCLPKIDSIKTYRERTGENFFVALSQYECDHPLTQGDLT